MHCRRQGDIECWLVDTSTDYPFLCLAQGSSFSPWSFPSCCQAFFTPPSTLLPTYSLSLLANCRSLSIYTPTSTTINVCCLIPNTNQLPVHIPGTWYTSRDTRLHSPTPSQHTHNMSSTTPSLGKAQSQSREWYEPLVCISSSPPFHEKYP